jgi:hypothetical protein
LWVLLDSVARLRLSKAHLAPASAIVSDAFSPLRADFSGDCDYGCDVFGAGILCGSCIYPFLRAFEIAAGVLAWISPNRSNWSVVGVFQHLRMYSQAGRDLTVCCSPKRVGERANVSASDLSRWSTRSRRRRNFHVCADTRRLGLFALIPSLWKIL